MILAALLFEYGQLVVTFDADGFTLLFVVEVLRLFWRQVGAASRATRVEITYIFVRKLRVLLSIIHFSQAVLQQIASSLRLTLVLLILFVNVHRMVLLL